MRFKDEMKDNPPKFIVLLCRESSFFFFSELK